MLEIACFNTSSAIAAAKSGADRVELCDNYTAGGLTPSIASLPKIRTETTIPVNVMIRPRAGDFNYSSAEFEQMKLDMKSFKSHASGFVFGILDSATRVDEARNRVLVELATPLPCTFHRAIDDVGNLNDAVEMVIACGFTSILTSGGKKNAVEGAERVAELQRMYGNRIQFILGGGVRSTNVAELKRRTGMEWLHSAAITKPGEEVDQDEVIEILKNLEN